MPSSTTECLLHADRTLANFEPALGQRAHRIPTQAHSVGRRSFHRRLLLFPGMLERNPLRG